MACPLLHHNEDNFPNSHAFIPERWIDPAERKRLDKYMVAFSKGSRQCLGKNLALAEFYLAIAALFSRLDFELYETTIEDVEMKRDLFIPSVKKGSKGIRVLVK